MNDPYNLQRFIDAQRGVYEIALKELRSGRKQGHWMWFVFPQIAGLGRSSTAQFYGISDRNEARAYLAHPFLGPRLREAVEAILAWSGKRSAEQLLGGIDAMKLRSCLTLSIRSNPVAPSNMRWPSSTTVRTDVHSRCSLKPARFVAGRRLRSMRKLLFGLAALTIAISPATAALKVGDKAPDFTTTGAVGGKEFKIHLADQLKKGPVVLYFFPKAFTSGCTAEAHAFSESIGDFKKAGAQVIGMSADDLKTLHDFSAKECRSAFPVATATPQIQKAYDVAWAAHPGITTRTSYVIGKSGKIAMVHDDLDFSQHVAKTLAAVKALK